VTVSEEKLAEWINQAGTGIDQVQRLTAWVRDYRERRKRAV
jgi:hypothetical protein